MSPGGVKRDEQCDGCIGSRKCWVCLGAGEIESGPGRQVRCHACYGSGICPHCRVIRLTDLNAPDDLIPRQQEA